MLQQKLLNGELAPPSVQATRKRGCYRRAPRGLNDGKGFVFISHTGEVFPSGFMPLSAGNVRLKDLAVIYKESPLFKDLRDTRSLKENADLANSKRSAVARVPAHML